MIRSGQAGMLSDIALPPVRCSSASRASAQRQMM
jgi:hypothetical protein